MAAKTIHEAIDHILYVGPLSTIRERALGELRDFFSHEVGRMQAQMLHDGITTEAFSVAEEILNQYFNRIFKDVPACPDPTPIRKLTYERVGNISVFKKEE